MEDLRGRQLVPELARDGRHGGLEDLGSPAVGGDRLRDGASLAALELGAVAREVVEHPPRLVLLGVQAGEHQQPPRVVAGLDDARVEAQPVALGHGLELDLLDVEAELVQAPQPLLDPVALVGSEDLLARELSPQRLVGAAQRERELARDRAPRAARRPRPRRRAARPSGSPRRSAGRARAGRARAARAARRSRRRRGRRRARPRRAGRACSRASSRPRRSRRGGGARAAGRARRAGSCAGRRSRACRTARGTGARTRGGG